MTKDEFINKAIDIASCNYIYAYGFTGQILSEASIQAKAKQYPEWYTEARKRRLMTYNGNKACDCSGLIKYILKDEMFPDFNADHIYSVYCKTVSKPYAGCLAHKKGHIGICISDTKVVEASSSEGRVIISDISRRNWTEFGEFTYLKEEMSKQECLLQDLKDLIEKYGG